MKARFLCEGLENL